MAVQKQLLGSFILISCVILAGPVRAQDIFVRPNAGGSAKPPIDYGIKAQPTTPPPAAAPSPQPPASPPPQSAAVPSPMPEPEMPSQSTVYSPPEFGKNVTIFKTGPDPRPRPGRGSSVFTVNYRPGFLGEEEKNQILQTLGLNDKEIQTYCSFHYSLMLSYGKTGAAYLQTGAASSVQRYFNPPLNSVQIYPAVACRSVRPPVSGLIIEQGDHYLTTFAPVECPPGNRNTATAITLAFRYLGDGKGECTYQ